MERNGCSLLGFDDSTGVQTGHCDQRGVGRSFQVQQVA